MRLVILCIGSPRGGRLAAAIRDYEERAARYFRFDVIEVPPATGHGGRPEAARAEEARALLRRLPDGLQCWALTRTGKGLDSRGFADELGELSLYGKAGVAFIIGGAFGLGEDIVEQCDRRLSLSQLTLPHEMARLLLAEQIYRAGTILRREPYHKGA